MPLRQAHNICDNSAGVTISVRGIPAARLSIPCSRSGRNSIVKKRGYPVRPGEPAAPRPARLTMFDVLRWLRESTATVTDGAGTVPVPTVCDQAARLARTLAEHGVGPDTRVGVCADRGIGMLTALLGVWWAGGAIVPLEPDFPLPRLEIMARDAGLRLVVSDGDHAKLASSLGGDLVVITLEQNVAEPLDPVVVPADALAYTVFTSGSAGPAGVDITRRALANVLAVGQRDLGLGPGDRFVAVTTAAFDIALLELLLPLVCGTHLVIAAAADTREASRLRSLIERNAATALHATPHVWRLLRRGGDVPASLRLRLCSGDRLPAGSRRLADCPGRGAVELLRPHRNNDVDSCWCGGTGGGAGRDRAGHRPHPRVRPGRGVGPGPRRGGG